MEMETCPVCKGDGLIGNGSEPHLKQGELRTCYVCKGTGKVSTETPKQVAESPEEESEKKDVVPEVESVDVGPVDE